MAWAWQRRVNPRKHKHNEGNRGKFTEFPHCPKTASSFILHESSWKCILTKCFFVIYRFIFCRAVLTLYAPTQKKPEFIPQCLPSLPESVHPSAPAIQSTILQIADALDAASSFNFSEVTAPRERRHVVQEQSTDWRHLQMVMINWLWSRPFPSLFVLEDADFHTLWCGCLFRLFMSAFCEWQPLFRDLFVWS